METKGIIEHLTTLRSLSEQSELSVSAYTVTRSVSFVRIMEMSQENQDSKKRLAFLLPWLLLVIAGGLLLLSYRKSIQQESVTDFAMGTVISAQVYGKYADSVTGEIVDNIKALDAQELSWRISSSELGTINESLADHTETVISEDMYGYLADSRMLCEESGGALDITIHPLIDLWGIETDAPRIPTEEEIQACMKRYDYQRLTLFDSADVWSDDLSITDPQYEGDSFYHTDDQGNADEWLDQWPDELSDDARAEINETRWRLRTAEPGMTIDLGALGKGIAADQVRLLLGSKVSNKEIRGAVVSIGGTILTCGNKPGRAPWQVGIRNPRGNISDMLGTLSLRGTHVISTSGDYEQYFEENGRRYHHIFDPKTGYPAESGLMSVTIVCEDGIYSDGLSTACFILGMEDSLELLELYDAEAVFVTTDRRVYVTEGLQGYFTLTDDSYTLMP